MSTPSRRRSRPTKCRVRWRSAPRTWPLKTAASWDHQRLQSPDLVLEVGNARFLMVVCTGDIGEQAVVVERQLAFLVLEHQFGSARLDDFLRDHAALLAVAVGP